VARVLARFEQLRKAEQDAGRDAPNLDDVLAAAGGATERLTVNLRPSEVSYVFPKLGGAAANEIHKVELYQDTLSGMHYFFGLFPLGYVHHDDRINPRAIGASLRGLVEEFFQRRPQLHVALGWLATKGEDAG
jgi:hypothetical protein